ncbi:MAG: ferrous iron transporter B [Candidatus Melainabacteria bacterium]|nr:MAG: ferrous iron transporter B [Candidatus Melainabacteria bacterium]
MKTQTTTTDAKVASIATKRKHVVLVGNPNVGKSVIFNALSGLNADVSNYPGTTIDIAHASLSEFDLYDSPGVYGISSINDEERATRKIMLEGDIIINVASALSLDRDLFLTLQLIDTQKPLILVINQVDEAIKRGLKIDASALEAELGIPVIECVAVKKQGIQQILNQIENARPGISPPSVMDQVQLVISAASNKNLDYAKALLFIEGDDVTLSELPEIPQALRIDDTIYSERRAKVDQIVSLHVIDKRLGTLTSIKLGRLLLHPVFGTIAALAICYLIFYQLLGVWVAGDLVDLTEKRGMKVHWEPNVRKLAACVFPSEIKYKDTVISLPNAASTNEQKAQIESLLNSAPKSEVAFDFWKYKNNPLSIVGNLLVGEYGVLTLTVTYLLGLLFPLVAAFYFGLALLEDSGYLPRLAVLVDRLMNKIGLNGRAIIPLILGLGCVTMATITTRLLTSTREKIIATALLGIAIPCSAQLGVVTGTLARAGGVYAWAVYGTVVSLILAVSGLLLNQILPGKSQPLIIDLPPMRLPRADNVFKKTWNKTYAFLREALPMFALAGAVVSIAQMLGWLDTFVNWLKPVVTQWLLLPSDPRIPTTFILGIVRRDFASFGLTEVVLTAAQAVTAMIVITLFVPCIATVGVMIKERGMKIAMTIWIGSWVCAFVIGGVLARVLPPFFAFCGAN